MSLTVMNIDRPSDVYDIDLSAEEAVKEAERIFNAARSQSYLAYKVNKPGDFEQLHGFDPTATQIIMTPQMCGG